MTLFFPTSPCPQKTAFALSCWALRAGPSEKRTFGADPGLWAGVGGPYFGKTFTQLGLNLPKIWGSNSLPLLRTTTQCALSILKKMRFGLFAIISLENACFFELPLEPEEVRGSNFGGIFSQLGQLLGKIGGSNSIPLSQTSTTMLGKGRARRRTPDTGHRAGFSTFQTALTHRD